MSYDVVILGAGVIGSAAAFHLQERGCRTVLVGDGRKGATDAAAGMLSPAFEHAHETPVGGLDAMLRESFALWPGFAHRLADDPEAAFGYRRDGVYGIGFFATPQGAERVRDPRPLPAFSRQPKAFAPKEGSVEPRRLVRAMRARFEALGGTVIEGTGALGEGGLSVNGEEIGAGAVVLATGADPAHAPEGLQAVRGRALLYRLADEDRGAVPKVVRSPTAYFCPRADGTLYVGATEEWPGAISGTLEDLERDARRLLPCLERAERLAAFDGLRPFVRRSGPLLVRSGTRQVVIRAQGHHRHGVLLAPFSAQAVEDLLLRG